MSSKKKLYDHNGADKLEDYFRAKKYHQKFKGTAPSNLYLIGIPFLEKKGFGLGKPITASYDELARAACLNPSSIRPALEQLAGELCEVKIGLPIKGGGKATEIRRYTIQEMEENSRKSKLLDHTPDRGTQLAKTLRNRSFPYGDNPTCNPVWNIARTGRVTSAMPNVQGDPEKDRAVKLQQGCGKDEVLFHLDFKKAEPTIIQHIIGFQFESCPYNTLATLLGCSRDDSKKRVNMLAYCRSAISVVDHWPKVTHEIFMAYAQELDAEKERIWALGRPLNRTQRRFAHTLSGTKIVADRDSRNHKGKPMNWKVQGTVADIINATSLKIIGLESSRGWKFCFPEHDAIYVIGKIDDDEELVSIMEGEAKILGVPLKVKLEVL